MSYAWTVTNALAGLAATNLSWASGPADATRLFMFDRRMGKQFVCTAAASGNTLTVDMLSSLPLRGWALLNHNLASFGGAVTAQIQATDDVTWATGIVTAKAVTTLDFTQPHTKDFVLQFAAVTKRYWRIILSWTGTQTLKVGEVFAYASTTALTRKDIYGTSGEGHEYRIASVQTEALEERSYLLAGPRRTKRMSWTDNSFAERQELEALFFAAKGPVNPVLLVLNQAEVQTAAAADDTDVMFGKLEASDFSFQFADFSRYATPVVVLRNLGREVGA